MSGFAKSLCGDTGEGSLRRARYLTSICSLMLDIAGSMRFYSHIGAFCNCSPGRTLDVTYHKYSRTGPNDRKVSISWKSDVDLVPFQAGHPPSPIAKTNIKRVNDPEEKGFRGLVVIVKVHFL